jgi:dTDP-glucose 4,6-dehydratase
MILNALDNQELPVHGDGKNIRDWLHIDDHCRAIDLVLHKGRPGEIYNVASNKELENIDLVEYILDKLNCSKNLVRFILNHPEYDQKYSVDISKIRNELGWVPKIKFETGIEQTIDWYKDNSEWISEIASGEYLKNFKFQEKVR